MRTGRKTLDQEKGYVLAQLMLKDESGKWVDVIGKDGEIKTASLKLDSENPNTGETVIVDAKSTAVVRGRTIIIGLCR